MRALTIQGSYVGSVPEMQELLDLVRPHRHAAGAGLTTRPLDEVNARGRAARRQGDSAAWC